VFIFINADERSLV